MKKTSRNKTRAQRKYSAHKKYPWQVILILIAIPLTVLATQFPQTIRSSAQTILASPPVFFCLATGESNKDLCASSSLRAETVLQLNGFELNRNKTVYYNDTITGSATYTNTGDVPVTIKKVTLVAETKRSGNRLEFNPNRQNVTVQSGKTVTVSDTARIFASPNTGGIWNVFSSVTMGNGQRYDNSDKTIINVSTACTGLRAVPLTDADLGNLKSLCTKTPQSKLCTSRQYCELSGRDDCKQPAPKQEHMDKQLQCDENIILPEEEQNVLEELCKEYPGTDTCKDFCARTIDSPICPDRFADDENAQTETVSKQSTLKSVAGISTIAAIGNTNCRPGQQTNKNTGECCKYQGPNLPSGQCPRAPEGAAPAPANPAPGGAAPAPAGGGAPAAGGNCSSGTLGIINGVPGQCCRHAGGVNAGNQCCKNAGAFGQAKCPTASGGVAAPAPAVRFIQARGTPARTCAAGSVRNSAGRCVRSGGGGAAPAPANPAPFTCDVAGNNQCGPNRKCVSSGTGRNGNCLACQNRGGSCKTNDNCCGATRCVASPLGYSTCQ